MPVVHRIGPYRFYFWSNENRDTNEPPHIHIGSAGRVAKFWLSPVSLDEQRGYTPREIARLQRLVTTNRHELLRHWHEYFGTR